MPRGNAPQQNEANDLPMDDRSTPAKFGVDQENDGGIFKYISTHTHSALFIM